MSGDIGEPEPKFLKARALAPDYHSALLEAPEAVPPYDWLAICLYEGQPLRAAELLRADPSFRYRIDLDIRAYVLRDAALDLHEVASSEGGRKRWWYVFERDAGFDTIRGDPQFQALVSAAKAHAAAERESLDQMRDRGQVPARSAKKPSGAGVC